MRHSARSITALCAVTLGLAVAAPSFGGATVNLHTNRLTFSGPVRLPGVTLAPGSYLFERVEATNRDVIVVRSDDRMRTYLLANTQVVDRPAGMPANQLVTLSEARRGEVPAITAWYPVGEQIGHAFLYGRR